MWMAKFRNKKTKEVIEEHLIFYIEKLRKNPNFIEIKEEEEIQDNKSKNKKVKEEENTTPQN